jgi:ribulose-5-phosphate 4-epimerase/fuculose-1-phosphate aldolase
MVARVVEHKSDDRLMREDLAACHRLIAQFGWTELIYNHATARVPGRPEHMFVKPDALLYEQVNASNLVECDLDGTVMNGGPAINRTVPIIHGAIYKARPDLNCILHTHTPSGMAISALDCGLLPLNQTAMQFHDRLGYHDFHGVANDRAECESLVRDLGPHGAMIMRNHGLLTAGATIGQAFVRMYYLEKSCHAQLMAMNASTGGNAKLHLPPPEICEQTAQCWDADDMTKEWPAYIALLEREQPDYRD